MTNFNNFNNQAMINQMNFARNYEKHIQTQQIKKKSSGLGFYLLAYDLGLNAVVIGAMMVLSIVYMFQNKDSAYVTELFTDTSSPLLHFTNIVSAVFGAFIPGLFYLHFSKTHPSDCIQTQKVKPSGYGCINGCKFCI